MKVDLHSDASGRCVAVGEFDEYMYMLEQYIQVKEVAFWFTATLSQKNEQVSVKTEISNSLKCWFFREKMVNVVLHYIIKGLI